MSTQPSYDPYKPVDQQPLKVCGTCGRHNPKRLPDGTLEMTNGGCTYMGYSYISIHCTCAMWQKRRRQRREEEE